ncbi:ribosomal RNA small subunit methyltransferase A [candidate division KSB1 bacterium]|nr:ribosomal RNA small subunit methyltransferase A [candidate division KSB1 bacterium]
MLKKNIKPKKSLGQNFLKDENVAKKIVAALSIKPDDFVLEIGAGTGVLTKYLVHSGATVIAVEIDKNLFKILENEFPDQKNVTLYQEDFLKLSFKEILGDSKGWKVIGNLPYVITSPVLFKIFESSFFFDKAVFMMQKEVAQRIAATPNSKEYGILSIQSQYYADVKKLFDVSRNVFFPVPEVTSSVVEFVFKQNSELNKSEERIFRHVVRKVFSQRRKMLRNSLKTVTDFEINLDQLNFDLKQRPEQLTVSEFINLSKQIAILQRA